MTSTHSSALALSADNIVLRYPPRERELPMSEQSLLRRWVASWIVRRPDAVVAIGCDGGAARAGRMTRLRRLRDLLVDCGLTADRVRYTDDPIDGAQLQAAPGQPTLACLKVTVMGAQSIDGGVLPMRSVFPPRPTLEA